MKKWQIIVTVLIALLAAVASLLGLMSDVIYAEETTNWATQAIGQDVGNLIAIPVMLAGAYAYYKGSHKGFLIWTGSLFYFLYAYVIYGFAVHLNALFLAYVALIGLCAFALVGAYMTKDQPTLKIQKQASAFPAITLMVISGLFATLWLQELIPALLSGTKPASLVEAGLWVNPVHVIDLSVVLPGMILAGVALKRGKGMGYNLVAPWLTFSVLMGASIVVAMIVMTAEGYANAVPPMVMVGLVVVASIAALYRYLKVVKV